MTASITGLSDTWAAYEALTAAELRRRGAMKWSTHPDDVLRAWIAEMDFGTAPVVAETLARFFTDNASLGYAIPAQVGGVAEACAVWLERDFGVRFDLAQIVPVGDIVKAFEITVGLFRRPSSAVVVPTSGCLPFLQVRVVFGREVLRVPMIREVAAGGQGRWLLDLDGMERAFRSGAGVLALCNPHNPLGVVHGAAELAAVAELADRYGVRVFADEVHAPFVFGEHRHVPYASVSDTATAYAVTATSASKDWNLQGLKCAQLIITNPAAVLEPVRLPQTLTARVPGLLASAAAFRRGGDWLATVVGYLARNRMHLVRLMKDRAPELDWDTPEWTYMALLGCGALGLPADRTAADFFLDHARVSLNNGVSSAPLPGRRDSTSPHLCHYSKK